MIFLTFEAASLKVFYLKSNRTGKNERMDYTGNPQLDTGFLFEK